MRRYNARMFWFNLCRCCFNATQRKTTEINVSQIECLSTWCKRDREREITYMNLKHISLVSYVRVFIVRLFGWFDTCTYMTIRGIKTNKLRRNQCWMAYNCSFVVVSWFSLFGEISVQQRSKVIIKTNLTSQASLIQM